MIRVALIALLLCLPRLAAAEPEPATLMIENGLVVTMDPDRRVIENGVVVIDGPDIRAVGTADLKTRYRPAQIIDAHGGIVMPGMANLHTHAPMVAFRGIGEYAVENLLFDVMFPLEKALLSRELIHVSARQAALEMALAGVTVFADMYYHEDEVARAAKQVGLRGVLGETVIGFPVVDAPEPYGGLAYAEAFIRAYEGDPLIMPAVAPHAAYTVETDRLLAAKALADAHDVPILMHLAEFRDEHAMVLERHPAMRPEQSVIGYLSSIGFLSERLTAAHVIYADAADMQLLLRAGVGVSHNPKANAKGASGIAPALEMRRAGIPVGLGTDGPMSSNQMDILTAMGWAAGVARLRHGDATLYTPLELVEMATIKGAQALHMEAAIGSLEAGKRADLVILDATSANMQPLHDVYAAIAFSAYPGNVTTTVVHGEIVVRGGQVVTIDLAAHARQWAAVRNRVARFAETLD